MINTVLSPKGGTGKSTITANIAGLLADFGYKVLMVDADPQQTLSSHYTIKKVADGSFMLRNNYDFVFADTIGTKKDEFNDLGIYAADFILMSKQIESVL